MTRAAKSIYSLKIIIPVCLLILGVASVAISVPAVPDVTPAEKVPPVADGGERGWQSVVITAELDYPWDIVHHEDTLFITEKAGAIVTVHDGQLKRTPVDLSTELRTEGGAGLLGIALAPDFDASRRAFLFYSYNNASGPANRVVSATFDGTVWRETGVVIDAIPGHRLYNGGRIAIGPDGHLYITTGWTEDYGRPQDLKSLAGKVLRISLNGQIPSDNPFPNSPVYSYGHRNPQGLAWSPAGELSVSEHGQAALDEINLIAPGKNYGWPNIEGDEKRSGMETPYIHSGRSTWAQSGIAFSGEKLFVAAL